MKYRCLVCFYDQMLDPPEDFNICPCCGTEFGNDDFDMTHAELRDRWRLAGMPWFSEYTPKPFDWDPIEQLQSFGQIQFKPFYNTGEEVAYGNPASLGYSNFAHV